MDLRVSPLIENGGLSQKMRHSTTLEFSRPRRVSFLEQNKFRILSQLTQMDRVATKTNSFYW